MKTASAGAQDGARRGEKEKRYGKVFHGPLRRPQQGPGRGHAGLMPMAPTAPRSPLLSGDCPKPRSPLIRKALEQIDERLDAPLNLSVLAVRLCVNPNYLSGLFHQEMGVTLTEYVTARRLQEAERLLRTSSLSITRIAVRVGIPDANYFSLLFKKAYGMPPSQFRRSLRGRD